MKLNGGIGRNKVDNWTPSRSCLYPWSYQCLRRRPTPRQRSSPVRHFHCPQHYVTSAIPNITSLPLSPTLRHFRCPQHYITSAVPNITSLPLSPTLRHFRYPQHYVTSAIPNITSLPLSPTLRHFRCPQHYVTSAIPNITSLLLSPALRYFHCPQHYITSAIPNVRPRWTGTRPSVSHIVRTTGHLAHSLKLKITLNMLYLYNIILLLYSTLYNSAHKLNTVWQLRILLLPSKTHRWVWNSVATFYSEPSTIDIYNII